MLQDADDEVDRLYAQLPTVACQGLCWNSCGPIDMSSLERRRVEALGVTIAPWSRRRSRLWADGVRQAGAERLDCAALTPLKRCSVYEARPFICRAWGVGRGPMACTHGCVVTGTRLTAVEIAEIVVRLFALSGDVTPEQEVRMKELMVVPEVALALAGRSWRWRG